MNIHKCMTNFSEMAKQKETLKVAPGDSLHHPNDSIPSRCSQKRRQAPVWGWFEKLLLEKGEKPTHAKCNVCTAKVSIINSATTPMINHMKRHHSGLFEKYVSKNVRNRTLRNSKEKGKMLETTIDTTIGTDTESLKTRLGENRITSNIQSELKPQETMGTSYQETVDTLESVKNVVMKKHPSLNIHQAFSPNDVPFIHIWKPISKLEGFQGMPFLPCFHIIGTIVCTETETDGLTASTECDKMILFQLHSFHGKVLADEYVKVPPTNTILSSQLVTQMANDQLRLCKGVEKIDRQRFVQFIRSCKEPSILSKVRSVCLIEQLMGSVVLRSRMCKYVLFEDPKIDNKTKSMTRCDECDALEDRSDSWTEEANQLEDDRLDSNGEGLNPNDFERVYNQTSAADMQELSVIQKFKEMYKNENDKYSIRKNQSIIEPIQDELTFSTFKSEAEELNPPNKATTLKGKL